MMLRPSIPRTHSKQDHKSKPFITFAVSLVALFGGNASQASDEACKVLDPELQGHYEGPCLGGLAEGQGTAKGIALYSGGFHAGMKHGYGEKRWANGDQYTGEFKNDTKEGKGVYKWAQPPWTGERYEGDYKQDQRHGIGLYTWPSGDRYTGPWEHDRMTGAATPMMILRHQSTEAALATLGKPGLRICRLQREGFSSKKHLQIAEVQATSGSMLVIKYLAFDGADRSTETNLTPPFGWYPCQGQRIRTS